jgi:hypothetical protein
MIPSATNGTVLKNVNEDLRWQHHRIKLAKDQVILETRKVPKLQ